MKTFTVTEINKYTRNLIKGDLILRSELSVTGEISGLRQPNTSGHMYFSLKEGGCVIQSAFFNNQRKKCNVELKEGMQITANGKIDLYETSGQYQLIISSIKETNNLGILYEKFLKLKEQLEKEGLFSKEHKKALPYYPKTIAVITSETGAVISDIVATIRTRCPNVDILLFPTAVQGETAPESIIRALHQAEAINYIDTVILARGGGSFEDLNCFNDEDLARAIYAFNKPIISAIGHETDFTIADYTADERAATPTAAAILAVPDLNELKARLENDEYKIEMSIKLKFRTMSEYLISLKKRLSDLKPERLLQMRQQQLDTLYESLNVKIEIFLQKNKEQLALLKTKLKERNPSLPLEKGYAWIYDYGSNKVISSANDIEKGLLIGLSLKGGKAKARVEDITKSHI